MSALQSTNHATAILPGFGHKLGLWQEIQAPIARKYSAIISTKSPIIVHYRSTSTTGDLPKQRAKALYFAHPQSSEERVMELEFQVQNVKCQGCASAIRTGLGQYPGVQTVQVDVPTGQVTVTATSDLRPVLSAALKDLGYPEKD